MTKPKAKLKRYLVVPRDAMDVLDCRFADLDEATEYASSACVEGSQAHYVLEMKVVATRATPPAKVTAL